MRKAHTLTLPEPSWSLPNGWRWTTLRVVHVMPDDQVDGWKVVLCGNDTPMIEVIHRDLEHAQRIALSAAAEMYPVAFKEFVR
jgi:hypothetical protein